MLFLIIFLIIIADQVSKYYVLTDLKKCNTIPIVKDVFHLTYVENRGAAFGVLQNKRWFFIVTTLIVSGIIVYYLFTLPKEKVLLKISLSLILGGAIGNLIDRIRLGFVVDFLDFRLINYPVFNIADTAVVTGTILLALIILFGKNFKTA
ncbi:MAG: signal peptidase II [Clostridia bacterium]|nr:signal peptidase II [Clostridia bacterium]